MSKNKTDISKTLVVLSDIGIFTSGIFIKIIMGHLNTWHEAFWNKSISRRVKAVFL